MTLHPHPSAEHVYVCYRGYLLSAKQKFGTTKSLIHTRQLWAIYDEAKRERSKS